MHRVGTSACRLEAGATSRLRRPSAAVAVPVAAPIAVADRNPHIGNGIGIGIGGRADDPALWKEAETHPETETQTSLYVCIS